MTLGSLPLVRDDKMVVRSCEPFTECKRRSIITCSAVHIYSADGLRLVIVIVLQES
jgi:hypothetical protein